MDFLTDTRGVFSTPAVTNGPGGPFARSAQQNTMVSQQTTQLHRNLYGMAGNGPRISAVNPRGRASSQQQQQQQQQSQAFSALDPLSGVSSSPQNSASNPTTATLGSVNVSGARHKTTRSVLSEFDPLAAFQTEAAAEPVQAQPVKASEKRRRKKKGSASQGKGKGNENGKIGSHAKTLSSAGSLLFSEGMGDGGFADAGFREETFGDSGFGGASFGDFAADNDAFTASDTSDGGSEDDASEDANEESFASTGSLRSASAAKSAASAARQRRRGSLQLPSRWHRDHQGNVTGKILERVTTKMIGHKWSARTIIITSEQIILRKLESGKLDEKRVIYVNENTKVGEVYLKDGKDRKNREQKIYQFKVYEDNPWANAPAKQLAKLGHETLEVAIFLRNYLFDLAKAAE